MNFPRSPKEEFEARLTALLLGELSDEEATTVRQAMEQDPELFRLHEQLKRTISLVREAASNPVAQAQSPANPLKLSEERRQRLLAQFKTVTSHELKMPARKELPWFIPMSMAAAMVALIGSLALMQGFNNRQESRASYAQRNELVRDVREQLDESDSLRRAGAAPESASTGLSVGNVAGVVLASGPSPENKRKEEIAARGRGSTPTVSAIRDQETAANGIVASPPPPVSFGFGGSGGGIGGGGAVAGGGLGGGVAGDKRYREPQIAGSDFDGVPPIAKNLPDLIAPKESKAEDDHVIAEVVTSPDGATLSLPSRSSASTPAGSAAPSVEAGKPLTVTGLSDATPGAAVRPNVHYFGGKAALAPGDATRPKQSETTDSAAFQNRYAFITPPSEDSLAMGNLPKEGKIGFQGGTAPSSAIADLNWIHATPAFSKEKQQAESLFSKQDLPENRGTNLERPVLANGQSEAPKPMMEPILMMRYGLLRPGMTAPGMAPPQAVAGSTAPTKKSAIVLPQVIDPTTTTTASHEGLAPDRAKRELEELTATRDNLAAGLNVAQVDGTAQAGSPVRILDLAKAESEESRATVEQLQRRARGGVERAARIDVGKDATDTTPILLGVQNSTAYDPYFIQTEPEKVRSKYVLYQVIDKLKLNEAWARKDGSGKAENLNQAETFQLLLNRLDVRAVPNSSEIEIRVKSDKPEEAARIANTIAEVYRDTREERRRKMEASASAALKQQLAELDKKIAGAQVEQQQLEKGVRREPTNLVPSTPAAPAPVPQPEIQTGENPFSTFSLNVSDVSFKLAAASLEKGVMPEPATVRSEEFINAFDYRDSEPPPGVPIAFAWERARYPFAHNRDVLRFSIKTASEGREAGRALNLVLLLDNSGSMERADRVQILREAIRVLAGHLQPQDKLSVIAFARTARLWADGLPGNQGGQVADQVGNLSPQGGTNLEEAMNLAYQTALRHYLPGSVNRVVLLTDGAANLGNVNPDALKQKVEAHRKQGIALDCFGIGWEGYNDDLLEVLSRNGDGRYGFINTPEDATTGFARQLAGALRVAAADVKVQVEFNPKRVTAYRQIGYAKHQLTQEQFRDNTVDAAEIGSAESGNALYVVEANPRGEGLLAVVRVRYKVPGTSEYHEHEWMVPYTGNAVGLEQAGSAMRLAATASAFSEWLVSSPYAAEVTPDRLLTYLSGVPETYGIDPRPKQLEWMIRQAKSVAGK